MGRESYTIRGNVVGSVVGGRHRDVHITNAGPDPDGLRNELDELRRRIDGLDPATPGRDQAIESLSRVEAAVKDDEPEEAREPLSALANWSQGLNLALGIAQLVDHVRQWIG